jgi:hypothetical protein
VVADFEAITVELDDLFPGQVVPLIAAEVESLGDEEGGAESILFQERTGDCKVRFRGIVERLVPPRGSLLTDVCNVHLSDVSGRSEFGEAASDLRCGSARGDGRTFFWKRALMAASIVRNGKQHKGPRAREETGTRAGAPPRMSSPTPGSHRSYHVTHGRQFRHGFYYPGRYHPHWAYTRLDVRYGCTLYYDPELGCYYWCEPDSCYYPVSYCPYNRYAWSTVSDEHGDQEAGPLWIAGGTSCEYCEPPGKLVSIPAVESP